MIENPVSVRPKTKVIGYGFFIPLFFAYAGTNVDLSFLSSWIGIAYMVAFFLLLFISEYFPKKLIAMQVGFSEKEAGRIAAGMLALGELTIVVAQLSFLHALPIIYKKVASSRLSLPLGSSSLSHLLLHLYLSQQPPFQFPSQHP